MNRRTYLTGLSTAVGTVFTGCIGGSGDGGGFGSGGGNIPPVVRNRPDAVYVPSHFEGMNMVGMGTSGGHKLALSYTFPHRFWTMQPDPDDPTERVSIENEDTMHLMASVWYPESGTYVTDASPTIEITKDGETIVGSNNPWAMLSQPMGFHFGDNVTLDGEGTYAVTVETSAPSVRRTGSLQGVGGRGTFEFEMEYSREEMDDVMVTRLPDRKGTEGAVSPMEMEMLPLSFAPDSGSMPGRAVGSATSGDATVVIRELSDSGQFGGGESESYLAVSPRTPHNGYVLPGTSLNATVQRGGSTVFDGRLAKTLDPALDFHYGATIDPLEPGDEISLEFGSPPQLARHEGYETAFLEMSEVTISA